MKDFDLIYMKYADEFQLLERWKASWDKNAPIGNKNDKDEFFYNIFIEIYTQAYHKKEKNKKKNFAWKCFFVLVLILASGAYIYFIIRSVNMSYGISQLISGGVFLFLLVLISGAISKWIDVKKHQETWSRHSKHIHLLEKEMLLFIYQIEPYDAFRREEQFVHRVMKIWDKNQEKFCENIENGEKEMMDVFDRMKGKE